MDVLILDRILKKIGTKKLNKLFCYKISKEDIGWKPYKEDDYLWNWGQKYSWN